MKNPTIYLALVYLLMPTVPFAIEGNNLNTPASKLLLERNKQLTPKNMKLADNVYSFVNYSVSTINMIEGDKGIVIVDTGKSRDDVENVLIEIRKITDKPIIGIIYTHGHSDHYTGTPVFLETTKTKIPIWARADFNEEVNTLNHLAEITKIRGARQGGGKLPKELRINNGVAPAKYGQPGAGGKVEFVKPTHTFSEEKITVKFEDIIVELHAAPGETDDELFVWYPKEKVLFTGDNMYRSFPNLYAVRGAGYRDVKQWINSIRKMMKLNPKILVFGHTLPTTTQKESTEFIKNYYTAIKFVYDKSIEGMNKGLTIDELVEYVKLPESLAKLDYLKEFYGNIAWSVRSIFVGHLGWFDGNASNLGTMTLKEEAQEIADLAGGNDQLLIKIRQALKEKNATWAAKLADYALALGLSASLLKAEALEMIASDTLSTTGRNYIFTQAQELRKQAQK